MSQVGDIGVMQEDKLPPQYRIQCHAGIRSTVYIKFNTYLLASTALPLQLHKSFPRGTMTAEINHLA